MSTQIVCPNCGKTITDDPLIASAIKGEDLGTKSIYCGCGERITFWAITAQLRDQKSIKWRFQNWLKTKSQSRV